LIRRDPVLISTVTRVTYRRFVFYFHAGTRKRYARSIGKLLVGRFAGFLPRCIALVGLVLVGRLVADDGVGGNAYDLALDQTVAIEIKRVDFDLGVLTSA
jgi:hypothetical protein